MPIDLRQIIDLRSTAVITVECQNAVIGPQAALPALGVAVRASGMLANAAAVLAAARAARMPVLHGTVVRRADGGGVTMNCRLFAAARKGGGAPAMLAGSAGAALVAELGPAESDYLVPRHHGVSVFHDTEMDALLRSLGVRTVILLGVSLNIALIGSTIEAVNRGYHVLLPRDGVVGTPPEYAEAVLENSMKLLATVTTCDAIVARLREGAGA